MVDPQSAAFLAAIDAPKRPVTANAGTRLPLWGKMQFAEIPDWDPSLALDQIRTHWEQVEGPPIQIEDPDGSKTAALLPKVASISRIILKLTMTNAAGSVSRQLILEIRPMTRPADSDEGSGRGKGG